MKINNFSEKLEAILRKKGLSQAELAQKIGKTARHLSRVKQEGDVSEKMLRAICSGLEIPVSYFIHELSPQEQDDYYPVPFREAGGSMGGGYNIGSRRIQSHISLRRDFLRRKTNNLEKLSFIHASGDSMFPSIPTDAAVLIDEGQLEPVHNKIFYILFNGEYFIKRLEVREGVVTAIISDNGNKRIEISESDNLQILGRAILQQSEL